MIKKISFAFIILFTTLLVLLFIFISPVVKYTIEKYDKDFLGREITIESLWLNILNGHLTVKGLTIYEDNAKTEFIYLGKFEINITVYKLYSEVYDITSLKIETPRVHIIQTGSHFNFDDISKKFATDESKKSEKRTDKAIAYSLTNLALVNGEISYENKSIGNKIELEKINISSPIIANNTKVMDLLLAFAFKTGGNINSSFSLNTGLLDYKLNLQVDKFDLHAWYPYLEDYINIKSLEGNLNTKLDISGNFKVPEDVKAKGTFNLSAVAVTDPLGSVMASFKSLDVNIDSLNAKAGIYSLQEITLTEPYFLFELYDNGNNFFRLLKDTATHTTNDSVVKGEEYSNIFAMMAGYIKDISKNYLVSNYNSDRLSISSGHIIYADYTLADKFKLDLANFNIHAENIRSTDKKISLDANAMLNNSGKFKANLQVNPKDFKDLALTYSINELQIADFNPYAVYYVATPFVDGVIEYESTTTIENHFLKSSNNLKIQTIRVGDKVKNKTAYNLPIKLAVSILRDPRGDIKLNIPVEGNLDDPKYKLGKVIWQILKNLLLKAVTAPYKLLANALGGKEEDFKEIKFSLKQEQLLPDQLKRLDIVAKLLKEKKDINVEFIQVTDEMEEMEYMALENMKREFWFSNRQPSDTVPENIKDSISLIDIKDSLFLSYVDSKYGVGSNLVSMQEKCIKIAGEQTLKTELDKRKEARNSQVASYLTTSQGIDTTRFRILYPRPGMPAAHQASAMFLINYNSGEEGAGKQQ